MYRNPPYQGYFPSGTCFLIVQKAGEDTPSRVRPPAGSFLLVQKGTKDTLRGQSAGSASSAKSTLSLTGGFPPKNPLFTGDALYESLL